MLKFNDKIKVKQACGGNGNADKNYIGMYGVQAAQL